MRRRSTGSRHSTTDLRITPEGEGEEDEGGEVVVMATRETGNEGTDQMQMFQRPNNRSKNQNQVAAMVGRKPPRRNQSRWRNNPATPTNSTHSYVINIFTSFTFLV